MFKLRPIYLPVLLTLAATIGCGPDQDSPADSNAGGAVGHSDHDGHDHGDGDHEGHDDDEGHAGHEGHDDDDGHEGHDHEALGPNGGHVVVVGDEAYHVEWIHDDETGKVTAILLDSEIKNEVTTTADVVTIEVTIGSGEPRKYELLAVDRSEDTPPLASRFELTEPALITALGIGEGVQVVLGVEIDGQTFHVPVEHESHAGHAH